MMVVVTDEALFLMIKIMEESISNINYSVTELKRILAQTSVDWNDKRYHIIEELINYVCVKLQTVEPELNVALDKTKNSLVAIQSYLQDSIRTRQSSTKMVSRFIHYKMSSTVSQFESDRWNVLDLEYKKNAISDAANVINKDLGIVNPPKILYFHRKPYMVNGKLTKSYGSFMPLSNVITINTYYINNGREILDTIAHETRHAQQFQIANNPQTEEDLQIAHNLNNYITYDMSPTRYWNQLVEVDARNYARLVTDQIGV